MTVSNLDDTIAAYRAVKNNADRADAQLLEQFLALLDVTPTSKAELEAKRAFITAEIEAEPALQSQTDEARMRLLFEELSFSF